MNSLILLIIVFLAMLPSIDGNAQNPTKVIDEAKLLLDEGRFQEGYNLLVKINDNQIMSLGDSCTSIYYYQLGASLYFLDKFEEALPHLERGLQAMEKIQLKDCNYLEVLYGIGACYKNLGNYPKAEEYLRRSILRGTNLDYNCAIRNKTYEELADLYSLMGKPELADICLSRIASEMRILGSENVDEQINELTDLYQAYERQGNTNKSISTLRSLVKYIEENRGKTDNSYLIYSYILGCQLQTVGNKPNEAASIFIEIIDIGHKLKTYRETIYFAYEEYLRHLALNHETDSITMILPEAEKYFQLLNPKPDNNRNLYEIIGLELCYAGQYEEGVRYLEKKWNGITANSIAALEYLGQFYFQNDPERALSYYKRAESQIMNGLDVNDHTKQTIYEFLMYLNERLGNLQEAIKYAELAEPFIIEMHNDTYYLRHLVSWATECINANDIEKANQLMNKVDSLLNHGSIELNIGTLSNMGFVYLKSGKLERAISTIDKGIKLAINEKGEKCMELTTLYHNLGRAYMLNGDYKNALTALYKSKNLQIELEGEVMQRTTDYINECEGK